MVIVLTRFHDVMVIVLTQFLDVMVIGLTSFHGEVVKFSPASMM